MTQVAAPAAAGLVAGVAGVAAPFVVLAALLLLSTGVALRSPAQRAEEGQGAAGGRTQSSSRAESDRPFSRSPDRIARLPVRSVRSRPVSSPDGHNPLTSVTAFDRGASALAQ
jgi:hypothetical protein